MGSFKKGAIGNAQSDMPIYSCLSIYYCNLNCTIIFALFSYTCIYFFSLDWLNQLSCFAPFGPISGSTVPEEKRFCHFGYFLTVLGILGQLLGRAIRFRCFPLSIIAIWIARLFFTTYSFNFFAFIFFSLDWLDQFGCFSPFGSVSGSAVP